MSNLTRRDALKAMTAGLLIPAAMAGESVAGLPGAPETTVFPKLPAATKTRTHEVTVVGDHALGDQPHFLGRVNADHFFGFAPGHLVSSGSTFRGDNRKYRMAWRVTWTLLEKVASTWNPWVWNPRFQQFVELPCHDKMPMQPIFDKMTRSCVSWRWAVDGQVVRHSLLPPSLCDAWAGPGNGPAFGCNAHSEER